MRDVMYMKWGEAGPESCPQSEPGDAGSNWMPCVLVSKEEWAEFDSRKQTVTYEKHGGMIYERLIGDGSPDYADFRRREYPSIEDQLDALWKGGSAAEDMKQRIMDVKSRYPKPV